MAAWLAEADPHSEFTGCDWQERSHGDANDDPQRSAAASNNATMDFIAGMHIPVDAGTLSA